MRALSRSKSCRRGVSMAVGLIVVPMLPYLFKTYGRYLPSRQLYLACMVFMLIVARLIQMVKIAEVRAAAVVLFCVWNVYFMWTVKNRQFLERAAPTTELLRVLQARRPTHIRIEGFPYPEPDIAKDVSFLVPGWTREMIDTGGECGECASVRWDGKTYR